MGRLHEADHKQKKMLDSLTPAWCDKPYRYNLNVKANEEITVKVEWQSHSDNN